MNDQDWQIRMRPEDFLNKKSNGFETMETMRAVGLRVLQKSFNYQEWLVHPEEYALCGDQHWYRDVYLKSNHWREIRTEAISEAGHVCRSCGVPDDIESLDVHHLTYERLGFELPDDVIALCRKCHKAKHDSIPRKDFD